MHSIKNDIFRSWKKFMPKKRLSDRNMVRYNRLKKHDDPDIRARVAEKMLLGNIPLIPMAITRHGQKTTVLDDDDFFQTCIEGMITAIQLWNPDQGSFSGYFLLWARQKIDRQLALLSREISIKADALMPYRRLKRVSIENGTPYPKKPCDMSQNDYDKASAVLSQRFVYLDGGGQDSQLIADRVGDECELPDDTETVVHTALNRLNDREQFIIRSMYGIDCEPVPVSVLRETLGITGTRVYAIERVCRIKLKKMIKDNPG